MTANSHYFDTVEFTFTSADTVPVVTTVSCQVRAATLTPDTPVDTRRTLCGPSKAVGVPDWTLSVDYDQDWDAAGISTFLIDHVGAEMAFKLDWTEGLSTAEGTILVIPGPWGGTAGEVAEGTVDLPVIGQPTFTAFDPAAGGGLAAPARKLVDA
jgi:hypothetical protein